MKNGFAVFLLFLRYAALVFHGAAHSHLNIGATAWQNAFIAIAIFLAPLISAILMWTRIRELGILLLGLSLTASLIFGVSYHFVILGPDNVWDQCHSTWCITFQTTAVLLATTEIAGVAWCIRNWYRASVEDQERICL